MWVAPFVLFLSWMASGAEAETVVVDFATIKGMATHRASGFLHGISEDHPDDQFVRPLKPRLFRIHGSETPSMALLQRLKSYGAAIQYVVSDAYGYPGPTGRWPGDGGDWRQWEELVESLVREADRKGLQLQWDIWNEPDSSQFWDRSAEQFAEAWKRAVVIIRRLSSKAEIVGPSLANGPWHYLYGFLLAARDENVLPDIVSWHDWSLDHPPDVSTVRQFMAAQGIAPRPISINEFQGAKGKQQPGLLVWWLSHIEAEGPESAAYSCWPDPAGYSDCDLPTLDGLLTRDGKPRAVWFIHQAYADLSGKLVEVMTQDRSIAGLAGFDQSMETARLILGRREVGTLSGVATVDVVFRNLDRFGGLSKSGSIFVRVECVPSSGTDPLENSSIIITEGNLPVKGNEVRVDLGEVEIGAACIVILRRARDQD
ncbi:MAG: hypothetical protein ABL983_02230 [Nitrospira sp.]